MDKPKQAKIVPPTLDAMTICLYFQQGLIVEKVNTAEYRLIVLAIQVDKNKKDIDNLEWLSEFDKTIDELEDQKLKNELLQMELEQAKQNVSTLSESISKSSTMISQKSNLIKIKRPFNICVLGEVSDTVLIRKELNNYFEKIGLKTKDWNVNFFNNTRLQNSNILRSLQKGQSNFELIITGQIHHHSAKGNARANILSELKNEKYIPHLIGSSPKNKLTAKRIIDTVDNYFDIKF